MGMRKHRFIGLDRDVWLPDDIVVEISIVPASVTNVRSNSYFVGQTSYTQHETANFNTGANADMHRNWLHGGASGSSVGFNFVVDDRKIIQLTPLNEVTWAAGNATGNTYSYHAELCVNADINHTIARRNAAALAGGILAAKGWLTDKLYQHNIWWGKNCPMLLRQNGLWPSFVNNVATHINLSKAAVSGGTSTPTPAPVVGTIVAGDYVKTIDTLNVRQGYGLKYPVVKELAPDSLARVGKDSQGNYKMSADGYVWLNIAYEGGSGWAAADWLIETAAPKAPEPEVVKAWPYPAPIVPSFWSELMKEGTVYVKSGNTTWFRANDLYEVKAGGTKRLQKAIESAASVGPNLAAEQRFRGAALGISELDGKAYVITPGLTMVSLDDVIFVDDEDK